MGDNPILDSACSSLRVSVTTTACRLGLSPGWTAAG